MTCRRGGDRLSALQIEAAMAEPQSNLLDRSLSDADCYRLVRAQIEFESTLITQRLSWLVAAQAFLFSAYAITLNAPKDPATPEFATQYHFMFHLIPVVAFLACALLYVTILGGVLAQGRLRRHLRESMPASRLAAFPAIQGSSATHLMGLAGPLGLPLVFVAAWVYLWTRGLG